MKTFNILYIDDDLVNEEEKENKIDPLVRGLSSQGKIDFIFEYPRMLESFVDLLAENYQGIDAILIDLKLNENHTGMEDFATYPAQILANAIRTYQNGEDQKFVEFPLFLISSLENKKALYESDIKSHDLFDFFVSKNDIAKSGIEYEDNMYSIIEAYKEVSSGKKLFELLNIEEEEYNSLSINYDSSDELVSTTSQFIFNNIIMHSGVLINENILAARLGIDIEKSEDWSNLLEIINPSLIYEGIFSKTWIRWWSNRLLDWWESEISEEVILINSTADERVKLLKDKFGLEKLITAEPIDEFMKNSFWTVCKALNKPLDIYDGLVVNRKKETWQDKEYVSPKAVFEGESKKQGIKLHPNEKNRYEKLKKFYDEYRYGNKRGN